MSKVVLGDVPGPILEDCQLAVVVEIGLLGMGN